MPVNASVADLIFEIRSEEIPASYQRKAIIQWQSRLPKLLKENLFNYKSIEVDGSATRLFVYIKELALKQKVEEEVSRGPAEKICYDDQKKPTAALQGFANKAGITTDEIIFEKGYATTVVKKGGQVAAKVLPILFENLTFSTRFAKTMRWANFTIEYARPILSVFLKHGDTVISNAEKIFGSIIPYEKGLSIKGKQHAIKKPADYFSILKKEKIVIRSTERREKIIEALHKEAEKLNTICEIDEELLTEVVFLVDSPRVIVSHFPKEYLTIPEIVAISEMQEHQRYFPLRNKKNQLSDNFLIVSNNPKAGKVVAEGNARVLNARLSDGAFFFKEDRKKNLIFMSNKLKAIAFLPGLGTIYDKKERLKKIASFILHTSNHTIRNNEKEVSLACDLLKADLTSSLVFEFEHLQGEIGKIYATLDKHAEPIPSAILEHYQPRRQGDSYPKTDLGVLLSLSEKIDNIIAAFLIGKQSTSSQDPLGLRRQALYFIEIVIENKIHMNFSQLVNQLLPLYEVEGAQSSDWQVGENIWDFIRARIATIFEKQGFDKKLIRAALFTSSNDIFDLHQKLEALKDSQKNNEFINLISAFRRMSNILDDYRKIHNVSQLPENVQETLFEKLEERALYQLSLKLEKKLESSMMFQNNYEKIFQTVAESKQNIDTFFENVMVMADDLEIRNNRIALLNSVVQPIKQLFNLNEIK